MLGYWLCCILLLGTFKAIDLVTHKIIGGWLAKAGEFPYQVSLTRAAYNYHFCGGTIYDEYHIITAAHCLTTPADAIVIRAGSVVLSGNGTLRRTVSKLHVHEEYDQRHFINDIAILRLKEPLVFGKTVSSIDLQTTEVQNGTLCIVSGWGITNQSAPVGSAALHVVDVPIVRHDTCRSAYEHLNDVLDSMLCAGLDTGGKDACQGDSGGPLVCNNTLAGVVSWGMDCAHPIYPGVYTKISAFTDWISKTVDMLNSNANAEPTSPTSPGTPGPPSATSYIYTSLVWPIAGTTTPEQYPNGNQTTTDGSSSVPAMPMTFMAINILICFSVS